MTIDRITFCRPVFQSGKILQFPVNLSKAYDSNRRKSNFYASGLNHRRHRDADDFARLGRYLRHRRYPAAFCRRAAGDFSARFGGIGAPLHRNSRRHLGAGRRGSAHRDYGAGDFPARAERHRGSQALARRAAEIGAESRRIYFAVRLGQNDYRTIAERRRSHAKHRRGESFDARRRLFFVNRRRDCQFFYRYFAGDLPGDRAADVYQRFL